MKIALVVASYFIISISMVFMNKFLLNDKKSIPAPFFVTWYVICQFSLWYRYQCILTALIDWALGLLGDGNTKCMYGIF